MSRQIDRSIFVCADSLIVKEKRINRIIVYTRCFRTHSTNFKCGPSKQKRVTFYQAT